MTARQIESSLKVLLVTNLRASKKFYADILGCEVTPWWAIRDGFKGLAVKLLQAASSLDVRPNPPALGNTRAYDVYVYVSNWSALDALHEEFAAKGAHIHIEPWIAPNDGPWKEFALRDPDGYSIAFGGVPGE